MMVPRSTNECVDDGIQSQNAETRTFCAKRAGRGREREAERAADAMPLSL